MGVLLLSFVIYKVGTSLYFKYRMQKWEDEYQANSYKVDTIIVANAEKRLKLNDLIVVCELRKSLWNSKVSITEIQKTAELSNRKYKLFSDAVKKDLLENTDKSYLKTDEDIDTDVIGKLCTQHYPDSPNAQNNVYSDLLSQKYKLTGSQDSISYVDISLITNEDLSQYKSALEIEKKIRLNF